MLPKWFVMSPAPVERGRRTRRWKATSRDGALLGFVEWYRPWRCYAFFPHSDTIFEKTCLRDLADWCEQATSDHLAARRREREAVANGTRTDL